MVHWDKCVFLLAQQFEHGRKTWGNLDLSTRWKIIEDYIRMVDVFQRLHVSNWKVVRGVDEYLAATKRGEKLMLMKNENPDELEIVLEALKTNTSLLSLRFQSIEFNTKSSGWDLSSLDLSLPLNPFGDDGIEHLSDMLHENSSLLYLDLSRCEIDDYSALDLSRVLKSNSTLLYLNLERNWIGDDSTRDLSEGLKHNSSLLYLHLPANKIGSCGAQHLSEMLRVNSTLLYLSIGRNEIGDEGTRYFSEMLHVNSTLLYLDFEDLYFCENYIQNDQIEDKVHKEVESRKCVENTRRLHLSYDECRSYLQSVFDVPTWTSSRCEYLPPNFQCFPPEVWGEIVSFLSNDGSTIEECFLVPDLRSGFYWTTLSFFCASNNRLLKMIPLIEGHFRCDLWTSTRLFLVGLDYSDFQSFAAMNSSSSVPKNVEESNDENAVSS